MFDALSHTLPNANSNALPNAVANAVANGRPNAVANGRPHAGSPSTTLERGRVCQGLEQPMEWLVYCGIL